MPVLDVDRHSYANTNNLVWDVNTLTWVKMQQPSISGGTVTISGTVTANAGTNLNTSALALETTLSSVLTELQAKTEPANQQHIIIDSGSVVQGTGGSSPWLTWQGLKIPVHDYISISYTGSNLTGVVFKTGGSGGTTVATLTLGYTGSDLTTVTKS